jgi:cytochrome c oxidase subunit 3
MPTTKLEPLAPEAEHAAALAHHFDDLEQQHSAGLLGMWLFLATEIMFFGGMFAAYTVYRTSMPETFASASRRLDVTLGTINTAVLLTSSFTMALAVDAAHRASRRGLAAFLWATIVLGSAFLAIKFTEYYHKFEEGHLPLLNLPFRVVGEAGLHHAAPHEQLFFSLYLAMTGFHALHMVIGIAILGVLAIAAARGRLGGHRYFPVEMTGLYWHFVDVVWIFLFPLLYLIHRP